jgi:hypothetical protein
MLKLNINRFSYKSVVGKFKLLSSVVALTSVVLYSCQDQVKEQVQKAESSVTGQRGLVASLLNKERTPEKALLAVESQVNYDLSSLLKSTIYSQYEVNETNFTITVPIGSNGKVSSSSQQNIANDIKERINDAIVAIYGEAKQTLVELNVVDIEPVTNTSDWVVTAITAMPTEIAQCYCMDASYTGKFKFAGFPMNGVTYGASRCEFASNNMTYSDNNPYCKNLLNTPNLNPLDAAKFPSEITAIHDPQVSGASTNIRATNSHVKYEETNQSTGGFPGNFNRLTDLNITLIQQAEIFDNLKTKLNQLITNRNHNKANIISINAHEQTVVGAGGNYESRRYLIVGYSYKLSEQPPIN